MEMGLVKLKFPAASKWLVARIVQFEKGNAKFVAAKTKYGQPATPFEPLKERLVRVRNRALNVGCAVGEETTLNAPVERLLVFQARFMPGIAGETPVNAPE